MLATNQEIVPKVIASNSLDVIRFDYQITYNNFSQRSNDCYSNVISPPGKEHPKFYVQLKPNCAESSIIEYNGDNTNTVERYIHQTTSNFPARYPVDMYPPGYPTQVVNKNFGIKLIVHFKDGFKNINRDNPDDWIDYEDESLINSCIKNFKVLCATSIINEGGEKCFGQNSMKYFQMENKSFGGSHDGRSFMVLFQIKKISDLEAKKCFPEGKLTFMCEFTIEVDASAETILLAEEWRISKLLSDSRKKFQAGITDLRANSKLTDVVLVFSNGKELKAHKAILAAQSEIFEAMFIHDTKEANENRVEIIDITAEVFEELLRYLYTDKVPAIGRYAEKLLIASDMYQLNILKEICEEALRKALSPETVSNYVLLADTYNAPKLKSKSLEYFQKNTESSISSLFKNNKADVLLQALRDISIGTNPNVK